MRLSCVLGQRGRTTALLGLLGISASVIAFSLPAEAAPRRAKRVSAYSPPYAAMVVDAKTGRTLHAQNEDALRHPASVTKVMTLYLLFEQLERGKIALDTPLRVSANAAGQAPSKLGLEPGETIEVEDAIKALITKSANDIAVVVAENLAGTEDGFAEQMTRKARALGMTRTVYRNASGLPDPQQVTTARDLTILARAVQERFPRYYRYFQTRTFHYAGSTHHNHNKLLGRVEGVDGIKTGFTRASGFNLMTNAKTDDRHIVAVVLGGRSGASRDQIMASLVQSTLPRAYAGVRGAPLVTERSERSRVVEAPLPPVREVEATAAVLARPATTTPLDLSSGRAAVTSAAATMTTPNTLPPGPPALQALPAAAQAYAPVQDAASAAPSPSADAAIVAGSGKIQARLAALEPVALTADVAERPVPAPRPTAARTGLGRSDLSGPGRAAATDGRRGNDGQEPRGATPRPGALSAWIIQLGATDDEAKAKAILNQAKSRAGRALAKALPFTEKIVREGATLYRARFSGFEAADTAQEACKLLKRSGFNCFAGRS
jgi:D-alanyl-D-alanine carboxypeptidase